MATVAELLAQRAELDKKISDLRDESRIRAIEEVRKLMDEFGLTVTDLGGKSTSAKAQAEGKKVAPKFRDPETGNTWSGRGLQPKWLSAAIAAGKTLADYGI